MNPGTIAVAVDGSEASAAALVSAVSEAKRAGVSLRGVFVLDTGWADYIGNDWQSAAGARQGFLDYIREQLEAQAEAARQQFAVATAELDRARFDIIPGEPLDTLCELVERGEAATLFAGQEVFQICGRPSVKRLAGDLRKRVGAAVRVV